MRVASDRHRSTSSGTTFYWKDESVVRVSGGRTIRVRRVSGADPKAVRLSILGPAFSQLLTQRGRLVLHASAVLSRGKVIAFVGRSGAGKTTLAAALNARGYELVTDNQLVIQFKNKKAFASPTFAQFKLWPDTAKKLGFKARVLPRIDASSQKRSLVFHERFAKRPAPVGRVYLLKTGRSIGIENAPPHQKLFYMINHSFGGHTVGRPQALSPHFFKCARLVNETPVSFLTRTGRLSALGRLTRAVEKDLACS